ncbi:beta-propeller domain-containing protein [Sphaerisporangium sp. B11E5]|uniref:beta-propeller domain-containing protein n=1 Tax=Sphaerisporangium sp. B11E5 TaxID=3153563 RepID=UPI00325CE7FF
MRTSIGTAAAVALALGLLATACTGGGTATPPASSATAPAGTPVSLGAIKLVSYSSCDDMLSGLREAAAKTVGPWGFGGDTLFRSARENAATAQADAKGAPAHSTTNVHEAGTDEPDLVKTDGERIITVTRGVLRVVDAATRKVTGTLRLLTTEQGWVAANLLVNGDRALVLLGEGSMVPPGAMAKRAAPVSGPRYVLVDLAQMKEIGSLSPLGQQVDARMVGSTVRIVVRSQPVIEFPEGRPDDTEQERLARNKKAVEEAPIEAWLPRYDVTGADGKTRTERVPCEQVSHPAEYTGTSMLTMHTIDLGAAIDGGEPISVAADGDTVYATPSSLYVTSNPGWWGRGRVRLPIIVEDEPADVVPVDPKATPVPAPVSPAGEAASTPSGPVAPKAETSPPDEKVEPSNDPSMPSLLPEPTPTAPSATPTGELPPPATEPPTGTPEPKVTPDPADSQPPERTEVHRFDITGPGTPRYTGSGEVPGRLLNQYSLSEHEGYLRVATTSFDPSGMTRGDTSSGVYVLKADTLEQAGEVTGLGKSERIYSVRFIGPAGYVVTFRETDPLYTLDLRDPAQPKVSGELKITGFSSYLHPAGDGRLLGIGQEASERGQIQGTQISLFDVSDPAAPERLAQFHKKESSSEAEGDPHAFFYWPATGQAVVPLNTWNGEQNSAVVLKVGEDSLTEQGVITHPVPKQDERNPLDPRVRRGLMIGETLWTLSDNGLKASDAATLDEQGWVPFT